MTHLFLARTALFQPHRPVLRADTRPSPIHDAYAEAMLTLLRGPSRRH